jgi:anti-sigma factor RsiW
MTITDETLSALIDGELSPAEKRQVEQQLAADKDLATRLAQLKQADELVRRHATLIDDTPMPASVLAMLQDTQSASTDNVVQISGWRRSLQTLSTNAQQHLAKAACLVLAVGLAGGYLLGSGSSSNGIQTDIAQTPSDSQAEFLAAISSAASGQPVSLPGNQLLQISFSFEDADARLCRHYLLESPQQQREGVICRDNNQWLNVAEMTFRADAAGATYQTATSSASSIDQILDSLMVSGPLQPEQEQSQLAR